MPDCREMESGIFLWTKITQEFSFVDKLKKSVEKKEKKTRKLLTHPKECNIIYQCDVR